jgi:hypothetical protein
VRIGIRVEGWMIDGLASKLPEVLPLLGAENCSHCFVRETPHVFSEFPSPGRI